MAAVHREGEVISIVDDGDGLRIRARLSDASAGPDAGGTVSLRTAEPLRVPVRMT